MCHEQHTVVLLVLGVVWKVNGRPHLHVMGGPFDSVKFKQTRHCIGHSAGTELINLCSGLGPSFVKQFCSDPPKFVSLFLCAHITEQEAHQLVGLSKTPCRSMNQLLLVLHKHLNML